MGNYIELQKEAFEANIQLPKLGLVLFTFGNASAVDRQNGVFAIKPSGVEYNELKFQDMVIVDFEGVIVEGEMRPSSDTRTHAILYKHWKGIGGIAHTHSTYATSWAQSQLDIPILGTTHADYLPGDVPCVPIMHDKMIERDYEKETGLQIVKTFDERQLDPAKTPMVIVANHGPFTWGKTVKQAVYHSAILEELAKMACLTKSINPETPKLKDSLIKKHFDRKHGKDSYYGQD